MYSIKEVRDDNYCQRYHWEASNSIPNVSKALAALIQAESEPLQRQARLDGTTLTLTVENPKREDAERDLAMLGEEARVQIQKHTALAAVLTPMVTSIDRHEEWVKAMVELRNNVQVLTSRLSNLSERQQDLHDYVDEQAAKREQQAAPTVNVQNVSQPDADRCIEAIHHAGDVLAESPVDQWGNLMIAFLERLDNEAHERDCDDIEAYMAMLRQLRKAIKTRLQEGTW